RGTAHHVGRSEQEAVRGHDDGRPGPGRAPATGHAHHDPEAGDRRRQPTGDGGDHTGVGVHDGPVVRRLLIVWRARLDIRDDGHAEPSTRPPPKATRTSRSPAPRTTFSTSEPSALT